MDFEEKQQLVRRISTGRLYTEIDYLGDTIPVVIDDPTVDLINKADWLHKESLFTNRSRDGIMSVVEAEEYLCGTGEWSKDKADELERLHNAIPGIRSRIRHAKFKKIEQKNLKNQLASIDRRIQDLTKDKNKLYFYTAEYLADLWRKMYIIQETVHISRGRESLLKEQSFIKLCTFKYYYDTHVSDKDLRELGKSDPWRVYWTLSKTTATPLFGQSAVSITDLQYRLIFWTKLYDFAYEHPEHPPNEIIQDDDQFDDWYQEQADKQEADALKNSAGSKGVRSSSGVGTSESFIPADREGASEVYALNSSEARGRIQTREKAVQKKGKVKEFQLPDVKRDIQMKLNQLAMQQGQ